MPNPGREWLRLAGIDRAVGFAVLTRTWQALAVPLNLVLIALFLSREEQGYYYTFASLLALQAFVELGLSSVVVNVASHEWAGLRLDDTGKLAGSMEARGRLASLGRLVFKWYAVASPVFMMAVGGAGYWFFSVEQNTTIAWQLPWLATVVLSGMMLVLMPFIALLEGCNQVNRVNYFRMTQAILSSAAFWLVLMLHGGLWAAAAAVAVNVLRGGWFVAFEHRSFFASLLRSATVHQMNWRSEIWPLQWRLAVSWLFGYFAFSLFTPVMFHYHGPVLAGQMGMTWSLASGIQSFAMAWLQPKAPVFGVLIANKQYASLDSMFFRTSIRVLAITAFGAIAVWSVVAALYAAGHPIAQRVLPPLSTAVFMAAILLMQITFCQSVYLRAHKREPLVLVSSVFGLSVGLSVWLLGSRFGATGAAIGYLASAVLAVAWETRIWLRCRAQWHMT